MDAGTGTRAPHILLLEDDRSHQDLLLRAFRDDPSRFRVSVAGTLREARQILGRDPPDLIISDWILPDGKGLDILPRRDGRVTIPLVIMTSFGDELLAVGIMKSGAIDYVVKSATLFRELPRIAGKALRDWENIQDRIRAEKAVQESHKRLADIIGFLPDAVLAIDNEGRVIAWNSEIEQMTGVPAAEMLGKGDHEYSLPFYSARRPILIDLVLADDGEIEKKYNYIQRDGQRITSETFIPAMYGGKGAYLWGTASALSDSAGNRIGAIEVIRDITERKNAELALQESERKYRFLIDNVRDIVWQTTPDLTFTYVSPAAENLTGYRPADLIGTSLFGILAESSARVVRKRLEERMEEYSHGSRDLATVFEAETRKKDGNQVWMEISSNAIFAPDGIITGFQGISRDITDRKRAEKALVESEVRFRDLFSNMSAGVVIYEPTPEGEDFIIRDVNRAVETIEQIKKADIVGKSVLDVFPGVVEFGLFAVFQRVARTGVAESHPVSMYHDNRIAGWRDNYVYKLPSGEVVALYEDVTGKRQAEEETKRLLTAVSEEKEKLSVLLGSIADEVWFADLQHRFTLANPRALEEFNLTPTEQPSVETLASSLEVLRSDGTPRPVEEAPPLRALAGELVRNVMEIVRTPATGERRYRQVSSAPVRDSLGTIIGSISVVRDVTEQIRSDENLRESEQRYRSVIENAGEGITVAQDGMLQYANARLLEMIQVSAKDIVNRPFIDFIHPDDRAFVFERYQHRIAGENTAQNYDFRVVGKDKKIVWVQLSAVRIVWNGRPATLNFLMDITERKQAEEKLRESRQILEGILNTIPVRVFWKNKDLTYLGCNTPFAQDAGFEKAGDIIGKDDYAMGWREQAELYRADDRAVIESGNAKLMIEEPQTTPAGDTIYILTSKMPLRDARGDGIGVLGTYLDITDRKFSEEKLRESEERYRALLNGAGIGVGYWSTDGTLLFLNEISYKRLKGTEADYVGRNMRELFLENADMYLDRLQKSALSPDPMEYEDLVSLPAGKGWYLSVYTRISRPDGSVMGIQVLSMDITGRKQEEEIRKAYETRLDSAMEIGSLAWWEMDLPDGTVRFDERKATMLGYPPEKFRNFQDFTALLHPDDYEPAMNAMKDHLEGRESRYHADYRILSDTGTWRWFRDVGGITKRYPDGSPAKVTGIVIDISASKEAEEALRSTETRFRALIQNSSDIIRILDKNGRIAYESASSERILGYPSGHLIGSDPLEYIHPDDLGRVKNDLREVLDRINPGIPTEFRIRKADGEYLWVDSIATNLLEIPGVNGIVVTTRPIQQRKEAEVALLENRARLANAMDIAGLVNWEYDVATGMFTFDDRFYALYETTAEREGGNLMSAETYLQEFVYPEDRPYVLSEIQKLLATTDPDYAGQMEHRITPRDGSVRTIISRYAPVMGPDGKVVRTYGANQDITDRKLMESEIRSLNTALEQRVRDRTESLAKTNKALEEEIGQRLAAEKKLQTSYDEKVLLLKEIHHRVKNNLQIIASLLNLQSRYITDDATLAIIRESQNRVKAMALVHEKLYRSEDIAHISLQEYIRFLGTGLFQSYDAKNRGIQFVLEIRDISVDINAAIPLGLILNELISNSLKYAFPEGKTGEVVISVQKDDHTLTVIFRDNGIGIPPDLDWKNTQSLGLRLVNTLVDQMDGTIELDRSDGTRFTLVLHEKEQKGPV